MKNIIVITGASSGFGALAARALALAGHTVYASMRETTGRNAAQVEVAKKFATENNVDLRTIELDVASQESADQAIKTIVEKDGRLDVVIHNAGHMVFGAAEAFTPEQLAQVYDTCNVLSTQRVNRVALPQLRKQKRGLVLWVGSTSTRGGTPPYLSPYFAAKAAMDALAVSYAAGAGYRWGIETSIIVSGAFTSGTNHFAHAGLPADKVRQAGSPRQRPTYRAPRRRHYEGFRRYRRTRQCRCSRCRFKAIVNVVEPMPFGKHVPSRVHIDPAQDGAEIVNGVLRRSCSRRNVPATHTVPVRSADSC